jgi:serine/threonine protein kinase
VRLVWHDARDLSLEFEYAGQDLSHFINDRKISQLSNATQQRIMLDIGNGLDYIHNQNIIHRDIKAENILFDNIKMQAVLCDFGLATKSSIPLQCAGGTPPYIPPEYLYDMKRGKPGDIWAFGITLLFVFGIIPLPRDDWNIAEASRLGEAREKMIAWLDKVRKSIPKKGYPLLRQMLAKDSQKRITAPSLASKLQEDMKKTSTRFKLAI